MCTVRNYCANHCTFKFVNIDYITMSKNVTLAVITSPAPSRIACTQNSFAHT